jgi:hypothetical protein
MPKATQPLNTPFPCPRCGGEREPSPAKWRRTFCKACASEDTRRRYAAKRKPSPAPIDKRTVALKRCPVCKTTKPRAQFNKANRCKDGLQPKCRACDHAYYAANPDRHKAWVYARRAANPEAHREYNAAYHRANPRTEYNAAYRAANREDCNARAADWSKRNIERKRASSAAWAAANPERSKTNHRKWQIANRDKECAKAARHRSAKMRACPSWADLQEVGWIYAEAQKVSRETGIEHHVDHIVPLQSRWVCGLHVPHNLRVVPGVENMSKGNRRWPNMPAHLGVA